MLILIVCNYIFGYRHTLHKLASCHQLIFTHYSYQVQQTLSLSISVSQSLVHIHLTIWWVHHIHILIWPDNAPGSSSNRDGSNRRNNTSRNIPSVWSIRSISDPHEESEDGNPIYEHCSHVFLNAKLEYEVLDLRWNHSTHNHVIVLNLREIRCMISIYVYLLKTLPSGWANLSDYDCVNMILTPKTNILLFIFVSYHSKPVC